MSVLRYKTWSEYNPEQSVKVVAEFPSTANNDLGRALIFIDSECRANRAKTRLEYPHLSKHIMDDSYTVPFSIRRVDGGFSIHAGDGADAYTLLDS